ncbi:MAG: mannose-1-phosphate guanylyltransferase, partial [Sideroxydans sp.]|nr:mannose-1-phosphate guanylyltransferase [Sideroxydans sp.]
DGARFGAHIAYSDEGSALETAGGIAFALPLLGDGPFAVVNGDVYCDYDFSTLLARAAALAASGDMAHLVLVDNPVHNPKGDFFLNEGRLTGSALGTQHSALTFSGIGLYQPALFSAIPRGSKAPLAPLLRSQIALDKVSGEYHHGVWMDIGTPQRLDELDKQLHASQNAGHV